MGTPLDVDPLFLDLTADFMRRNSMAPLVAGDSISWRFQVRDEDDVAQSLADATFAMSLRKSDREADPVLFDRRSDEQVGGEYEIEADADQTTEDVDDYTGKGWFTVRFFPEDESALTAIVSAAKYYGIRIRFGDGSVRTFARGRIEILPPRPAGAELP